MLEKIESLKAENKRQIEQKELEGITLELSCVVFGCNNHVLELIELTSPRCLFHIVHILHASKKYEDFCQSDRGENIS